jgi:hypothetical protein
MNSVERLLTFVEVGDHDLGPNSRSMSVRARHEAVLTDGRRVLLLDDRGWGGTIGVAFLDGEPSQENRRRAERDAPSAWAHQTVEGMQETARMVVGPDAARGDHTQADMDAGHWDWMSSILRDNGVEITGAELKALPHDVELSDRVLARIGGRPAGPTDAA